MATTESWDAFNVIDSDNVTEICVMCNYYISELAKGVRVTWGTVITLTNVVCCIALTRAHNLNMAQRYYLINLTITDLLYGFGFTYHSAIVDVDGPIFKKNTVECKARYSILSMLSIVTLFTITTMGLDRVIALHWPYKYPNWVTKKSVFCTIAVDWLVPAIIIAIPYAMMDPAIKECNLGRFITFSSMIVFSMTYFLFMILGVVCQLVLFMVARHHINKILPTLVGDERKTAAIKMNSKATITTLCVALPFIICASPKVLTYLYLALYPQERLKLYSVTLLAVTFYINVTNSFLNPFIYCWRMPEVRHSIRKLFRPNSRSNENSITQSTSRG